MAEIQYPKRIRTDVIVGARIIFDKWDPSQQYDIVLDKGKIKEIVLHKSGSTEYPLDTTIDARNHLIAPSLCHPHVHLDKCFLLSDPKYADLEIIKGDFAEAMELTSRAKARFEKDDLLRRGRWLICESIAAGVTHLRAFAEVDHGVQLKCLDAAIELKKEFRGLCEIQICAFAQDPILSGPHWEENNKLMDKAIAHKDVEVIGSTPYVEESDYAVQSNFATTIRKALLQRKHVDLHLDYHLDGARKSLVPDVIDHVDMLEWQIQLKTIVLGHCTRLTQNTSREWKGMLYTAFSSFEVTHIRVELDFLLRYLVIICKGRC